VNGKWLKFNVVNGQSPEKGRILINISIVLIQKCPTLKAGVIGEQVASNRGE